MKHLLKTFVNIFAVLMLAICSLSLVACDDIRKLDVSFTANGTNYSISVDLYRHLAPKTVDKVIKYVNEKYYDGKVFYKFADGSYSSQIMFGDLKFENGQIVKTPKAEIYGEFESNGTKGSDLVNSKGYIGIWRSVYKADSSYATSSNARNSGSATMYMPTADISALNGNTCIFAKLNLNDASTSTAFSSLTALFDSSTTYTEYVIYYTGKYNVADNGLANHGLTFHCITKSAFNELSEEEIGEIFVAENDSNQLVCYNKTNVLVAKDSAIKTMKVK